MAVVGVKPRGVTEFRRQLCHLADVALFNPRFHISYQRDKTHPHRLHAEHATAASGLNDRFGLARIEGKRLLAQHGLACTDTGERVIAMPHVGRGNVNHIDIGVLQQVLVGAVGFGNPVVAGKNLGPPDLSRGHGR